MAMQGFDPKFEDLPDYILGITREIWEERGLHTLRGYYSDDVIVRSPMGIVTGNEGVIAATMATLAEFPDRQLLGEDVIWSGDDEEGIPVVASHPVDRHPSGRRRIRPGKRDTLRLPNRCRLRRPGQSDL